MSVVIRLHEAIAAVCPIDGIGPLNDGSVSPGNVRIDYRPEATVVQITAAQNALASFDWSQPAQDTWEANQKPERKALRDSATQAIADIDTYLAIASPNNAQVAAQVRRLSQYVRAVIRRLIQLD